MLAAINKTRLRPSSTSRSVTLSPCVRPNTLLRSSTRARFSTVMHKKSLIRSVNAMLSSPDLEKRKFIDLFCGIGGMRLAYEAAGCECVFSSDWDKYAQITYQKNFGEIPKG